MLPPQTFYTQVVHEKGQKLQIWTWAPYRVQCPCLKSQHQLSWILLTFATAIMGTLSKTVRFPLYPSQWVWGPLMRGWMFHPSRPNLSWMVPPWWYVCSGWQGRLDLRGVQSSRWVQAGGAVPWRPWKQGSKGTF